MDGFLLHLLSRFVYWESSKLSTPVSIIPLEPKPARANPTGTTVLHTVPRARCATTFEFLARRMHLTSACTTKTQRRNQTNLKPKSGVSDSPSGSGSCPAEFETQNRFKQTNKHRMQNAKRSVRAGVAPAFMRTAQTQWMQK